MKESHEGGNTLLRTAEVRKMVTVPSVDQLYPIKKIFTQKIGLEEFDLVSMHNFDQDRTTYPDVITIRIEILAVEAGF